MKQHSFPRGQLQDNDLCSCDLTQRHKGETNNGYY